MTEDDAREAVSALVGAEGYRRLERLADLVIEGNERQNLIARSTIGMIWSRHILDSVQLLRLVGDRDGLWLDIGTGGGFPGLAIAAATGGEVLLVEPRRLRAEFLSVAVDALELRSTVVAARKVEAVIASASIISARAVAPVEKLLRASAHCATSQTRWLLLRGRISADEIGAIGTQSGMTFHVEHSLSDAASSIVVGDGKPMQ